MENNNDFFKKLITGFVEEFKEIKHRLRDVEHAISSLSSKLEEKPCIMDKVEGEFRSCKECMVKTLVAQIRFKNSIIRTMIYILSGLAVGTAVAGGWFLWIK